MDLQALVSQFFDEKGNIALPPHLTLAGLNEMLYQKELATDPRIVERITIRAWDYTESAEGEVKEFSRKEVNTRIKAVAARLQQVGKIGDRVAILAGNSAEYVFGFMGALYAGLIPVPLYDPNEPGHAEHLSAVLKDAQPTIILTNKKSAAAVRALFATVPATERPRVLSVDALPDSTADSWVNPLETPEAQALLASGTVGAPVDMPAFLQYTSGSTRTPAGVLLTNRSIVTNVVQIFMIANLKPPVRMPSWLPLHHDMGIILACFMTILGFDMEIMLPRDFIQNPYRWVKKLNKTDDGRNIYTAIPNFALELAARYGLPPEGEELDLSAVDGIIIGSEAVTEKAVEGFKEAFKPYGLNNAVIRPSYGMAEASLLLSTPRSMNRPFFLSVDRDDLAKGVLTATDDQTRSVVFASVGNNVEPMDLLIVDPETRQPLPDNHVGEIWFHGENAAAGYYNRPEDTAETFHNTLATDPETNWVATGDLGAIVDGELYITGRLKDLIIIAGRNHYPQDIEYTVEHASSHIRPASGCAFAIPGEDVEKLIILAERDLTADPSGDADAIAAIKAAVVDSHGIVPADIRIYAPDEVRRSSAGKIARRVNAKVYLESLES